jgi:hypothetical protein
MNNRAERAPSEASIVGGNRDMPELLSPFCEPSLMVSTDALDGPTTLVHVREASMSLIMLPVPLG